MALEGAEYYLIDFVYSSLALVAGGYIILEELGLLSGETSASFLYFSQGCIFFKTFSYSLYRQIILGRDLKFNTERTQYTL